MAARALGPARRPARALRRRAALDSPRRARDSRGLNTSTMGQQTNKHIKRKRRAAYLKRRKERAKAAAKKK